MRYEEYLARVQDRAGMSSAEEARRAVTATLAVLRECLSEDDGSGLPPELRRELPPELAGVLGDSDTANPQLEGQRRSESGGESTRESGQ